MDVTGGGVFLVGGKVITLFIILFAGFISRKLNIIDGAATKKLSSFLINVTMPLLIITSFQLDFDAEKLKNGLMIIALSVAVHIAVSTAAFFAYKPIKNFGKRKIYEVSSVFSNCAFLGYPVLRVIFGDELGIFYGTFYTIFFNIYIWTYGVFLITKKDKNEKKDGRGEKIKISVSKIFLNVGILSSVIGIIMFIFKIKMPVILYDSSKLIGDMTFPLSMIIIGSLVSEIKPKEMFLSLSNYYFIFIKLIFLPGFIALVCYALKLPALLIYIGTLMTAMPSAANVSIFAETYGGDSKSAVTNAGLSTLFSIGSIPLAIYFLHLL